MSRGRPAPAAIAELATLRAEHLLLVIAEYTIAEAATNGVMLNANGKARGIDPWQLFRKNRAFVNAYASEELREHLALHPHLTFDSFERQLKEEEPW